MKNYDGIFALAIIFIWLITAIGWVINVVEIFGMSFSDITGELMLKIIGVFVFPIGAFMGLFI